MFLLHINNEYIGDFHGPNLRLHLGVFASCCLFHWLVLSFRFSATSDSIWRQEEQHDDEGFDGATALLFQQHAFLFYHFSSPLVSAEDRDNCRSEWFARKALSTLVLRWNKSRNLLLKWCNLRMYIFDMLLSIQNVLILIYSATAFIQQQQQCRDFFHRNNGWREEEERRRRSNFTLIRTSYLFTNFQYFSWMIKFVVPLDFSNTIYSFKSYLSM